MGDDDDDQSDLAGLLFGYLIYREIREGRLDGDGILRAGCLLVLLVGALLGGGLLIVGGLSTPQYRGGTVPVRDRGPGPDRAAGDRRAGDWRTDRSTCALREPDAETHVDSEADAEAAPGNRQARRRRRRLGGHRHGSAAVAPQLVPRAGLEARHGVREGPDAGRSDRVRLGRLLLARGEERAHVRGPDGFGPRDPSLFACADYHRPTTAAGWVTFEIRDADAKGLVLFACLPAFASCEKPAQIRLD